MKGLGSRALEVRLDILTSWVSKRNVLYKESRIYAMKVQNTNDEIDLSLLTKERKHSRADKVSAKRLKNRRFAALFQISSLLENVAWLGTIFFVLMFFFGITENWNPSIMSASSLGLIVAVITIAFCELIQLLLSIEESAKRGANVLVEILNNMRAQENENAGGSQMENTPSSEI